MMTIPSPYTFACPECQTPFSLENPNLLVCPADLAQYQRVDGIWRMLPDERAAYYASIIKDYETVRQGRARGSNSQNYNRALPFQDLSGKYPEDWSLHAQGHKTLVDKLIGQLESRNEPPLKIRVVGAGDGWLSNFLTQRGHREPAKFGLIYSREGQ